MSASKGKKKAADVSPSPLPILPEKPTSKEMEEYINAVGIPDHPVEICPGSVVVDSKKFLHVQLLNVNNKELTNRNRWLFYNRLLAYCKAISSPMILQF